ncbi:bifunctional oligoribonuclease/PAP phosphatase NrnA [Sediminibacillus dalangtanensis]|uniref:Bifunctional oligoribonuclease/PAP phosphatase NrnA n=1 Tax=Sediminibacillus dalangtanensis TaxID=2729421 RepID=A0ABX7VTS3_9BACI|nr:bifunctional oligoribonuclease/PAP phosphatase NrnA [Sediminibacillus dalangtanensis]QTN00067.1 bifunctional oligoribonuclease/PAP phosphatase NrnA [Sediminibacillus dalangtanensis]
MKNKEIIEKIKQYQTIIIHRHVRPDPDAFGSQAGLGELIKYSFPEKTVYLVGDEDPSLSFLAKMDTVPDELYETALVIVCDTANQARIADQRYKNGNELIKIDHHPNVDPYGDYAWVETEASSTSEMIYELYLEGREMGFAFNDKAARLIYAGIVGDTGRFLFPSATKKTFQYASELVTYEFDRPKLYDALYNTKPNVARLKGYILQHFKISEAGFCNVKIPRKTLEEFGVTSLETSQFVGILGDLEGIKAWAFFVEEEDIIRVRLRSKGPVVNEIAAKYNGGGHPMAAGASVANWEETENVITDMEKVCRGFIVE